MLKSFGLAKNRWVGVLVLASLGLLAACSSGSDASSDEAPAKAPPALPKTIPFEKAREKRPMIWHQESQTTGNSIQAFSSTDKIPFDLKEQCASAVCGDPAAVTTPWVDSWIPSAETDVQKKFMDTTVIPRLNADLDAMIASGRHEQAAITQAMPRLASLKLDDEHLAFVNAIWFQAHLRKAYGAIRAASDGSLVVDPDALAAIEPDMSVADEMSMGNFLQAFIESPEWQFANALQSMTLAEFLELIGNGQLSQADTEKMLANNLIGPSYTYLQAAFPELKLLTPRVLAALQAGQDLSPDMQQDLSAVLLQTFIGRMIHNKSVFGMRPAPALQPILDQYSTKFMPQFRAALADTKSIETARALLLSHCRMVLDRSLQAAPDAAEMAGAQVWMEKMKNAALQEGLKMAVNSDQQQALTAAVKATGFFLPQVQDDLMTSIQGNLDEDVATEQARDEAAQSGNDMGLFLKIYSSVVSDSAVLVGLPAACGAEFEPGGLIDHAVTSMGKIALSWQTIKFPRLGAGVVAHETGHMISKAFQKSAVEMGGLSPIYVSTEACEATRHGFKVGDPQMTYTEEDFADRIASAVMQNNHDASFPIDNTACLMMGRDGHQWGTSAGLTMAWPQGYGDVHSPNFFRLIEFQLNAGREMPASCQTVVDQYAPNAKSSCN